MEITKDMIYMVAIFMMVGICIGVMIQSKEIIDNYNELAVKYNNLSIECPYSSNYGIQKVDTHQMMDLSGMFKEIMKNNTNNT